MTDLKKLPESDPSQDGVAYLWVSSRRKKNGRHAAAEPSRPLSVAAAGRKSEDPMSVPWGDIVETPLRLLRRLVGRG